MALRKEIDDFRKRLTATATVSADIAEAKKRNSDAITDFRPSKPKRMKTETLTKDNYATATGSSNNAFAVLAKIVTHLKHRHQRGYTNPLNLEEVLEETKQTDVSARIRHWLDTEALQSNVKVDVKEGKRYLYKPTYNIRGPKGLSQLLQQQFLNEDIGAISLESIEESLPNCRKILQALNDSIVIITRPDKKEFLFKKIVGMPNPVDEGCFKKLWRSSSVEGLTEAKISEFLQQHNIHSFGTSENSHLKAPKTKLKNKRTSKKVKELKHNAHVAGDIIDYDRE